MTLYYRGYSAAKVLQKYIQNFSALRFFQHLGSLPKPRYGYPSDPLECKNPSFAAPDNYSQHFRSTAPSHNLVTVLYLWGWSALAYDAADWILTQIPGSAICSTGRRLKVGRVGFAAHSQHPAPVAALSQHQLSTSGNLSASRNVGVYWRVISYNIYRIIKLLARYTRNNFKNMRFAARSQHSSSERSTFAAPQVVSVKIRGLEINK